MKKLVISGAIALSASLIITTLALTGNLPHEILPPLKKKGSVKIACIGDSITYGSLIKKRNIYNYPKQLGNILGDNYYCVNFGYAGCCVQNTADHPYRNKILYKQAKNFNPDIILFMLGTNDTKAFNWKSNAAFKEEYETFVKELINFDAKPKVYILTCPSNFGENDTVAYEITKSNTAKAVEIQKETARKYSLEIIDIYNFTKAKPQLFTDGVHPNALGAKEIAAYICQKITANEKSLPTTHTTVNE
jgi:lysophospholipase L1-like esterase